MQPSYSPGYRHAAPYGAPATIEVPHAWRRWVLPLGMLGLLPLAASVVLLPKELAGTVFAVLRIAFVIGYLALVAIGMSSRSRRVVLRVDGGSLYDGSILLLPAGAATGMLWIPKGHAAVVALRGHLPMRLVFDELEGARAIHAALAPTVPPTSEFLAKTTPTALAIVAWMLFPIVFGGIAQALLLQGAAAPWFVAIGIPMGALWLGSVYAFSCRRTIHVTGTHLGLPRPISGRREDIPYREIASVEIVENFVGLVRFHARPPRRFVIYDPDLLAACVALVVEQVNRARYR